MKKIDLKIKELYSNLKLQNLKIISKITDSHKFCSELYDIIHFK